MKRYEDMVWEKMKTLENYIKKKQSIDLCEKKYKKCFVYNYIENTFIKYDFDEI